MPISWDDIKKEASEMLVKLVKINTTNPPGNELEAANYLAEIAEQNGLTAKVIETAPQRGNVIISYQGTYTKPLILLSHLDVVGANPVDWEEPPFAGVIKEGVLWGRGTIDTKQLTVMEMMVLLLLKRNQIPLESDIVLIATADEESGSQYGLVQLLKQYGYLFKDAYVINEGGGFPIMVNDIPVYLCETGQKGMCQIRFLVKDTPSSNPYYTNNQATSTSAELIKRIINFKWEYKLPQTTQYLIDELLKISDGTKFTPFLENLLKAMSENTLAATIWNGGRRNQTTHGDSEVRVDCRILPGVTREMVEAQITKLSSDLNVEWEIEGFREGYESDFQHPLFEHFKSSLQEHIPNSILVPFISTGGSDSRFLTPYNSKVYGFSPMLPDMTFEKVLPMVHGVNERIPIDSLVFGIKVLYESIVNYYREGTI